MEAGRVGCFPSVGKGKLGWQTTLSHFRYGRGRGGDRDGVHFQNQIELDCLQAHPATSLSMETAGQHLR